MFIIIGCSDDTNPTGETSDSFTTLTDYLVENSLDISDVIDANKTWIISESSLASSLDDYYIIDIRSSDKDENGTTDYQDGHINGAVYGTLGTILEVAADNPDPDKPIVIVCYTGQSAGHAVVALRLSGYTDARLLKFGMSSWNSDFDLWTGSTSDAGYSDDNWLGTSSINIIPNEDMLAFPTLTTNGSDGESILTEQVANLLSNGFKGITSSDVLLDPESYFINNYWTEDDVNAHGHITGAYRIKPLTLSGNEIKYLDPNQTIVTYCWTGQTSSMMTAYLNVLGYDTKSLKFGVNSMIYSELTGGHAWSSSASHSYCIGENPTCD